MTLRVRGLTIDHGAIRAISNATFNVPRGSITAIIGANGAGKSTLLRTISGLKRATAGSILWDEIALEKLQTEQIVRQGIIHVPEGRSVVTELTVHENLLLGGLWRLHSHKSDVALAIEEVYQLFPRLNERKKQRADTLSGGERQMLAIGRGLIARPELLLLDEPSLGLAPLVVEQIFQTLSDLQEKTGMTILLVEQNAMSALRIASQGIVLDQGRVVIADNAKAIMSDSALRHAYLGY
jgi:branched-chain amino acid transport system ATP-binding protein